MKLTYNHNDIKNALEAVGLKRGDVVFSHSSLAYFGMPEGGLSTQNLKSTILNPILECIGDEGTFVVPTFSYSFSKPKVFDIEKTKSVCGILTEIVRTMPDAYRSDDPIFSVAAIGRRANELTQHVAAECFGKDSFWDRFFQVDGVVLNMNFGVPVTFIHYVERCLNVSYRYNKRFISSVRIDGKTNQREVVYFCRDLTNHFMRPDWIGIDHLARTHGLSHSVGLGRGYITFIRSGDLYNLIVETLKEKPFFLTAARKTDVAQELIRPMRNYKIAMPVNPTSTDIINTLRVLPRDIVSDGYDVALKAVTGDIPTTIHDYPTGTDCSQWIIPEKWTCYEGYVQTLKGKTVFSFDQNPQHVASYSKPFEGVISKKELLKHLYVHPRLTSTIPIKFLYYDSNWGLCCSQRLKDTLSDNQYYIKINSDFSFGSLKIGEIIVSGHSKETILLCVHLCDGKISYDGLGGLAVGLEVIRELLKKKDLKYTYRLLILPHNSSIIAYFSKTPIAKSSIITMFFLDMIGVDTPHLLRLSSERLTSFERSSVDSFRKLDPNGNIDVFSLESEDKVIQVVLRTLTMPMISLSREMPSSDLKININPYTTKPKSNEILENSLSESKKLVLNLLDQWELS